MTGMVRAAVRAVTGNIEILVTRGMLVGGRAFVDGAIVDVPPHLAHELVAQGWAEFVRPGDAGPAKAAFRRHEQQQMRAAGFPVTPPAPRDPGPWRPL
jgi:hypothetical protein